MEVELTMQEIIEDTKQMSREHLLSEETYIILDHLDDIEIAHYRIALFDRAKVLGCLSEVKNLFKVYLNDMNALRDEAKSNNSNWSSIGYRTDRNGNLLPTTNNFLLILSNDDHFESLCFNEFSRYPERFYDGKQRVWNNEDDADARNYCEFKYGIHDCKKLNDALSLRFAEKRYHPIKQLIEAEIWDGIERIPTFLCKWMNCEDTPYTREVSRLIFAGGINRLYEPGCKFDVMPVLIGTRQGEGKSTFVRWLALKDDFFREIMEIEGQKGMEAVEAGWICEMSELLGLTNAKHVESVKAFITRQVDTYRRPYQPRVSKNERQSIFIGTTNNRSFLIDKTGNRRFFPIEVHSEGYHIFLNEKQIKGEILQCWAEALAKYLKNDMQPVAKSELFEDIREEQDKSVIIDYRDDMICNYIEDKNEVCILELWWRALDNPKNMKPTHKDSRDISLILQATGKWKQGKNPKHFKQYGKHRYFYRIDNYEGTE